MASSSAAGGRERSHVAYARGLAFRSSAATASIGPATSACASSGTDSCDNTPIAGPSSASPTQPNSGAPESMRKHLKPRTPSATMPDSSPKLPGTTPPQKPTSTAHLPRAACRLAKSASRVVVAGIEFSGISTSVVAPPAAAARVAVTKPSHSVRPGSFRCTWVSTTPGKIARSSTSTRRAPAGTSAHGATCTILPPAM